MYLFDNEICLRTVRTWYEVCHLWGQLFYEVSRLTRAPFEGALCLYLPSIDTTTNINVVFLPALCCGTYVLSLSLGLGLRTAGIINASGGASVSYVVSTEGGVVGPRPY